MSAYTVREAKPEEQRELTRLVVRATMKAGHDEAFIDRSMPSLTVSLPMISGHHVWVAQDASDEVVGVVSVTPTMLQGVALLSMIFVDPPHWKRGIGRVLFEKAVARAKEMKAGSLFIYSEPTAEEFYKRMGSIRIGEGPYVLSPDVVFPHLLYIIPREA
jgi:N-acetylglutamate synthase-like GNAT family acetyltransferase